MSRGKIEIAPSPSRVVISYDGSPGANAAVKAVAARSWREQSEFCLLAVTDPITPSAIGFIVPPIATWIEEANQGEQKWIEKIAVNALQKLHDAGLRQLWRFSSI